ncbi:phage portal protein [Fructobacillus tropaeoli]|uniref:SPP1 family phage portal protein n=1 Tax=Fructobacillus tropaeoli TaxID=709323 RepID=A0A3F3H310_9LACO|nr:phage portal protein [Fructobacillus tropaeoli]GAP04894.1 SPP1 family phage portal protein [Fructobacillus tropaeoli]
MELTTAANIFKSLDAQLNKTERDYAVSLRYYHNQSDITRKNNGESKANGKKQGEEKPLRNADSRISSNYHQLLVDQKASYTGAKTPTIDVHNDDINKKINDALGDRYGSTITKLIVDASLAGTGWLHVWKDEDGQFRYGVVKPNQITPVYSDTVERKLLAVRRTYEKLDEESGDVYIHDEYWTEEEAVFFKRKLGDGYESMIRDDSIFTTDLNSGDIVAADNVLHHDMGDVPFIRFANNADETTDLSQYKGQIDAFDLTLNGFVNDVQDIQEVFLVLKNLGGQSLDEFMGNLRDYKSIKFETDGDSATGVDTLQIDIPVEAREKLLSMLNDAIYTFGQGLDITKIQLGTSVSGVAVKMMYSALEMKAAKVQAEFEPALNRLVRFILRYYGLKDDMDITQTWKRSMVSNDLEQAQVISNLANVSSAEAIAKNSPIVSDWQEEVQLREEENAGSDSFAPE